MAGSCALPAAEAAAHPRRRSPALALVAAFAGAAVGGWAIDPSSAADGVPPARAGAAAVGALLVAAGIGATWRWSERARRHAAERDRAAETLRGRAEILAALNDAVVATDTEGRIVAWSPSAARTYGYAEAEALGQRAAQLLRAEYAPGQGRDWMRAELDRTGRIACQVRQRRKDGSSVEIDMTAVARRGPDGRIVGWVSVNRDVTERLAAEAELKRASERLVVSERLASLGVLAAGVAHEINNPLAFVISNVRTAEAALDELPPEASAAAQSAREALRDAAEGAERVRRIVGELKTFSRPDDEGRGPVDVGEVLRSALAMARHEIKHRARASVDLPDGPLAVDANAARLGQVFLNLLVNAAQAIPEGKADRNEIRVRACRDGDRVRVEVSDTGTGIRPAHLGRIFEPFFTTKPIGVGTGLGLAICHGIVTSLGGEIEVRSKVGEGTRFTVVLPAVRGGAPSAREAVRAGEASSGSATAAEGDPPADPDATTAAGPDAGGSGGEARPPARRGRVLVVDDEPGIGAAIRRVLRRDHDVVTASSGREALSLLTGGSPFDAVLCDIMMPELTGMELHRVLRAEMPALAARMIFMSGGAFTPDAQAFLASVPNPSIAKPFDPQALRAVVARVVGQ